MSRDRLAEALADAMCVGTLDNTSLEWLRGGAVAIAHAFNCERPALEGLDPNVFEWEDCSVEDALIEVLDCFMALATAAQILAHADTFAFSYNDVMYEWTPCWPGGPRVSELAECSSISERNSDD